MHHHQSVDFPMGNEPGTDHGRAVVVRAPPHPCIGRCVGVEAEADDLLVDVDRRVDPVVDRVEEVQVREDGVFREVHHVVEEHEVRGEHFVEDDAADTGFNEASDGFAGGAKALQALVGGSADMVSGAYEHTINMAAKKQPIKAVVLQARYSSIVLLLPKDKAARYKGPADLKGLKVGVTAPGSSTNMFVNILLAKEGLKPDDVAIIGVGATAGAVAIMKRGEIDAISNLDPVISMLESVSISTVLALDRGESSKRRTTL
jgi:hypothetical protein